MKLNTKLLAGSACCMLATMAHAGDEVATAVDIGGKEKSFWADTEIYLDGRLRYEYADMAAKSDDSNVLSVRNRLGIITPEVSGFSLLAELEHTMILSKTSSYSAFPSGSRSVIADPDNFDLNRLQLTYKLDDTKFVVGRQKITHGGQRFIGAVGWRQNDQTFDAITVSNKSIENLDLAYSYANQVNRIFGTQAPAAPLSRFHGDLHMFRADYKGFDIGALSGFAYLLDFDNAAALSSNTYGLELNGKTEVSALPTDLHYLLTGAIQNDAGNNAAEYEEYYVRAELSLKGEKVQAGLGLERMTGDGTRAFQMPMGTNHKFNGFADVYLTTPADGLRDYHAWVGFKCPLGAKHRASFHHFSSDEGNVYLGYEFDYVAKKTLTENTSVLMKLAHFEGHGTSKDVQRASLQFDYSF